MSLADLLGIQVQPTVLASVKKVRTSAPSWATAEPVERVEDGAPIFHMNLVQGTPQWMMARLGIPTASQFHRIVTPKGNPSKSAEKYLFELLAERITGKPTVNIKTSWMDRGHEMEQEAVDYYEFQKDCETVPVGFVTNSAGTIGASPDRLVGDNGLLEIKVPSPAVHVGYLLRSGEAYDDHGTQVQGQIDTSKRDWSDLLSYSPGMPHALIRVERDEPFIRSMRGHIEAFSTALETHTKTAIERGWMKEDWKTFAGAANGGGSETFSQKGKNPTATDLEEFNRLFGKVGFTN